MGFRGTAVSGGRGHRRQRWKRGSNERTNQEVRGMRAVVRLMHVLALVLVPTIAFAQASITGTVKDTSGAVLPGVTVEASSPALIEKVRTVITDGSGQYRIVDLRPGTYSVT